MAEETIPDMRKAISDLESKLTAEQKRTAEAEAKARLYEARDAFREAGYQPKHAELFIKVTEGEITPDGIVKFADEYGLTPLQKAADTPPAGQAESTPQPGSNLGNFSRAGSGPGEGGQQSASDGTMTKEEWLELQKKDPNAARVAVQQGRVRLRSDNFYVRNQQ